MALDLVAVGMVRTATARLVVGSSGYPAFRCRAIVAFGRVEQRRIPALNFAFLSLYSPTSSIAYSRHPATLRRLAYNARITTSAQSGLEAETHRSAYSAQSTLYLCVRAYSHQTSYLARLSSRTVILYSSACMDVPTSHPMLLVGAVSALVAAVIVGTGCWWHHRSGGYNEPSYSDRQTRW